MKVETLGLVVIILLVSHGLVYWQGFSNGFKFYHRKRVAIKQPPTRVDKPLDDFEDEEIIINKPTRNGFMRLIYKEDS